MASFDVSNLLKNNQITKAAIYNNWSNVGTCLLPSRLGMSLGTEVRKDENMAEITLIAPPQVFSITQVAASSVPPLGVAYLAATALKAGHKVELIDALGEQLEQEYTLGKFHLRGMKIDDIVSRIPAKTDLVGICNLFSFAYPIVRQLTNQIKERYPSIPVVLGGVTPTALPEFILKDSLADFIIMGEGEHALLRLLSALAGKIPLEKVQSLAYRQKGAIKINSRAPLIKDLDKIPFPAYALLQMENYITARQPHGAARGRWAPVIATRGCPYKCSFCTAPHTWEPVWRTRSPGNVVDEIELLSSRYQVTDIHFEDLTVARDRKWISKLCDEIKRRHLKISWQIPNGTRIESLTPEILIKMKDAGCRNITFAPESGSTRVLNSFDKRLDLNELEQAVNWAVQAKLVTCAFFIIGAPDETVEEIKETFKLVRRLARAGIDECTFSSFTLLPGSREFFQRHQLGELKLNDDFFLSLSYMGDLSWAPSWSANVSEKELTWLRRKAYLYFFFFSYLYHPGKVFKSLWNVFSDVQETKAQRVLRDKIDLLYKRLKRKTKKAA